MANKIIWTPLATVITLTVLLLLGMKYVPSFCLPAFLGIIVAELMAGKDAAGVALWRKTPVLVFATALVCALSIVTLLAANPRWWIPLGGAVLGVLLILYVELFFRTGRPLSEAIDLLSGTAPEGLQKARSQDRQAG